MATDEEIDAAILRRLARTGDDLVRWKTIERRVPGTFWQKAEAFVRLYDNGKIYAIKIGGTPYVSLGDILDAEIAAHYRALGRSRPVRVT
jgi:hypothetical protein